jgi:hypothetical protein
LERQKLKLQPESAGADAAEEFSFRQSVTACFSFLYQDWRVRHNGQAPDRNYCETIVNAISAGEGDYAHDLLRFLLNLGKSPRKGHGTAAVAGGEAKPEAESWFHYLGRRSA